MSNPSVPPVVPPEAILTPEQIAELLELLNPLMTERMDHAGIYDRTVFMSLCKRLPATLRVLERERDEARAALRLMQEAR